MIDPQDTSARSVTSAPYPDTTAEAVILEEPKPERPPKTHTRHGYTTNKGHGQPKARRKMAAKSKRVNRRR